MDTSLFTDKNKVPSHNELIMHLGETYPLWQLIREYVISRIPGANEEWNHSGIKYGWSFRIKNQKRTILYFLPRDNSFKVAFVFGQKATDLVMQSSVSNEIKKELELSRVYAEGRGIRIDLTNESLINDVKTLIDIKLAN